ncbi:MAG: hypothetical protein V2A78_03975 [bacterium]
MEDHDMMLDLYDLLMDRTVIADSEAMATAMNFWGSLSCDITMSDEAGRFPA